MRFCSSKDCPLEATWAPKLCVPADGWPIGSHEPLQTIIGLPLCRYHVADVKAGDFLDPETDGGKMLREAFRLIAGDNIPPDFERAFVQRVSLNSPEWRRFEQAGGQAP